MKEFENRKFVIIGIFILVCLVFLSRLFYLQVIDDTYKLSAKNQALRYVTIYPNRGLIYDRNNKLLVYNEAAYDLMVIPKQVKNLDTNSFCNLIGISKDDFLERIIKARKYSTYKASAFEKQIPAEQYANISEKLYKFKGFYGEKRTLRKYPSPIASHVLGYISEISPSELIHSNYYKSGDYIGSSGLEKEYEEILRGKRGRKVYLVDVHNRVKGSYQNGKYDTLPISGQNITTSIDKELQQYGEWLMQNKRGSVVAIEPETGEILALITSPSYDPNYLVGRDRSENYKTLVANDSLDPLFNRAINAQYRPGSIFKIVQSLIALQEKVITPNTRIVCNRSIIGCHGSHSNDNLPEAIQHSCNPYFHQVYKRLIQRGKFGSIFKDSEYGLNIWEKYVQRFGFGNSFNSDIPGISPGLVPNVAFYNKWYGEHRWAFSTIYSNSIGEGEMGVVPIQMANLAAIIANRGFYITPHLLKSIDKNDPNIEEFKLKKETGISKHYFTPVIEAMEAVVNKDGGTARRARMDSIIVCGKTGTVQNKDRPDHSVFVAYAPKENPKIAISVYVEYSDFGGTWAAPIASLMIEKYLTGEINRPEKEKRIVEAKFLTIYEE